MVNFVKKAFHGLMGKKTVFGKSKIILLLLISLFIIGCATSNVFSTIEVFDNNVLMLKPHDILSNDLVRIELPQVEVRAATQSTTRTIYDRILEQVKVRYPTADAVLIATFETVASSSLDIMTGQTKTTYTYVATVFPIKYR